ncbi:ester cyclase [Yeosuana sp. MJ-SS3]|uniref:Ester cyclase n=1 Tax=Gilvirhabdus luticola TaxID=3079858 RepID=A0ABU3U6R2_9FLAO|nr:ester cyclase [Yeosuana sp. MJ-SS3]MDU8886088.1 ester cyclase [Yeosuana sp. MJ-SS3]
MKNTIKLISIALLVILTACNSSEKQLQDNIVMYSQTWDEIINNGNLDAINSENFDENITLISSPENIVGIEAFKDYYSNFVTGFSEVEFSIVDIFGQGDKLVKHWTFKGTHSGDFFGMPGAGKSIDVEGTTLVKMKDGKIAQEQDFMDNMVFLQQLGIVSNPENVGIIDGIYKSFNTGDIPAVLAVLDENVEWIEAEGNAYADGNPYIGPDAVLNGVFARVGADYEHFEVVDVKLHDMSNNQVLATLRYNGKLKKNGATIDAQVAHHWTLNNGKVIGFQQYVDTKQLHDANNK